MEKIVNCKFCGKEFITTGKAKYCSLDCRILATRKKTAKRRLSPMNYDENGIKLPRKPSKPKENNLVELAMKARLAGMSYGQYIALDYAKKHPIVRKWW